jgi:HEPN domain-containing protein
MSGLERTRSPEYWLTLATEDLTCAVAILTAPGTRPRHSVGFAAQAAEKALKAAVTAAGIEPPRSHDLVALAHRSASILRVSVAERDLRRLSDAHEQARYPAWPEDVFGAGEASELAQIATVIVGESRAGLRSE